MQIPTELYRPSLTLLTDLYQITMAYGYWKTGMADHEAVFHLTYRKNPFGGGFAVACGLHYLIDLLQSFRFDDDDLVFLSEMRGTDGEPLFETAFIEELRRMRFSCDLDAVPEGTMVFPHQPLVRVKGPIMQSQILETALLNMINFQTLIATKAARVCSAAGGEPVLEFGLRRAQGVDGALAATRAAYIGGCAATSNVLAGRLFGIPVRGTHAHSWVMAFEDELAAFEAYARAMPNNCVFLVDTYDTLEGVDRAIQVARALRAQGREIIGIRLDSGDLAYLSIEARKRLDAAGFPGAAIVASNDLDEHIIESLKAQGATINVWGVGTKLVTAYDEPALGGVYKLSALRRPGGPWQRKVKLSEQAVKTSTPGILQVRRYRGSEGFVADVIYDEELGLPEGATMVDPMDLTRRRQLPRDGTSDDLLRPMFRGGQCVYQVPSLEEVRAHAKSQMGSFHSGVKRFVNPHRYPVGLERGLQELKMKLILEARGTGSE
jgi:nicotinate phosphoribosyltransferase